MRLSLRFVLPLLIALSLFAWAAVPLTDALMTRWFVRDLEIRSDLIQSTVQESLDELVQAGSDAKVVAFFNKLTRDERLYAVGLCKPPWNSAPVASSNYPQPLLRCSSVAGFAGERSRLLPTANGMLHVSVRPIGESASDGPRLVLVHDMSFVDRRTEETRRYLFYFFVALGASVALITVITAQLSWRGWVSGMKALLRGEGLLRPSGGATAPEFRPIARDVSELLRDLERIYRPTDENQQRWTQETLRATLRGELRGNDIIVVSNREPYIHVHEGGTIRVRRPASGLVTALEPVMRACSGTWIAHGSGSADRETVDKDDRVNVPPDNPRYRIRRIWLTAEEEAGYYGGFANEGLWPLCHAAHVRPTFRRSDWDYYRLVNSRFADAVVHEAHQRRPGRAGAGLSLRIVAAHDPRATAQGDGHHFLAHPVAQSGSIRDMPMAKRDTRRAAGQQHHGFPHAVSLQQFPGHCRSARGSASRSRTFHGYVPWRDNGSQSLSDID